MMLAKLLLWLILGLGKSMMKWWDVLNLGNWIIMGIRGIVIWGVGLRR